MSERRTVVLLLVLAGLALWVFAVEGVGRGLRSGEPPPPPALVDCEASVIDALEVKAGGMGVRGRQGDGRWHAEIAASRRARVEILLADLADALCRMPALDGVTAAPGDTDFGLEPGAVEIGIERGGKHVALTLGRTTPAGNLLYARFSGDPTVLTIGAWFASATDRILAAARE